eukprot:scaffold19984_cov127-Isochrysis_galbana.AAC.4
MGAHRSPQSWLGTAQGRRTQSVRTTKAEKTAKLPVAPDTPQASLATSLHLFVGRRVVFKVILVEASLIGEALGRCWRAIAVAVIRCRRERRGARLLGHMSLLSPFQENLKGDCEKDEANADALHGDERVAKLHNRVED